MTRLLLTLATVATTGSIAIGIGATPASTPAGKLQVIGRERPLFLGGAVVTATALPNAR